MASFYDSELERQKAGNKTVNIALPLLAALEVFATARASKGQNVGTSSLNLYKDVQGRRESALERALGRDKAAADDTRAKATDNRSDALFGLQKQKFQSEIDKDAQEAKAKEDAVARAVGIVALPEDQRKDAALKNFAIEDPKGLMQKTAFPGMDLTDFVMRANASGAIGDKFAQEREARAAEQRSKEAAEKQEREMNVNIPGVTRIPNATVTKDAIEKVQKISGYKNELTNSIQRLESLYKASGTEIFGDRAREMESLVRGIQLTAKEFYNLGVLNGPDLALMETIIANPTGLKENLISMVPGAGDPVTPKLSEAKRMIDNAYQTKINSLGFQEEKPSQGAALVAEGTERVNKQGVKMRMTGGKWQIAQ